jgi:hypothetical protein
LCIQSAFGLICPESREDELDAAMRAARAIADEHNSTAAHTEVRVYILKGRIASSDAEAARAIASEITGLLAQMQAGIQGADTKTIREAASRARALGAMLDARQAKAVSEAVDAARKAAREITRRVERDGETAETVLRELDGKAIEAARFAFLDLDEAPALADTLPPPAPSALDLDEAPAVEIPANKPPELDLSGANSGTVKASPAVSLQRICGLEF